MFVKWVAAAVEQMPAPAAMNTFGGWSGRGARLCGQHSRRVLLSARTRCYSNVNVARQSGDSKSEAHPDCLELTFPRSRHNSHVMRSGSLSVKEQSMPFEHQSCHNSRTPSSTRRLNWCPFRISKANMKVIVFFLFFILCSAAFGQVVQKQSTAADTIQTELTKASATNVDRIEIFYFPEDVETEFAITPFGLERGCWEKIVIREFHQTDFRLTFLQALAESDIKKRDDGPSDLRWGCVFFDSNGNRILSIYFDQLGHGQINGIQISSNGKLLRLLRQKFALR